MRFVYQKGLRNDGEPLIDLAGVGNLWTALSFVGEYPDEKENISIIVDKLKDWLYNEI